jgi:hypothetical protein
VLNIIGDTFVFLAQGVNFDMCLFCSNVDHATCQIGSLYNFDDEKIWGMCIW